MTKDILCGTINLLRIYIATPPPLFPFRFPRCEINVAVRHRFYEEAEEHEGRQVE